MKVGFLGPIVGLIIGAIILTLFIFNTVTDNPWRWMGFALALAAFVGGVLLGYNKSGNKPSPPAA